jgi:hypothetical protein
MSINRSSRFVKYNVAYKVERVLDLIFLASPLFALAFLALGLYAWWLGWVAYALAFAVLTLGACVVAHGRFVAPWQLRVKRLEIGDFPISPKQSLGSLQSRPLRFVFFSDLHLARIKKRDWVQRVVELVNAQQPDVVLIGGDFSGVVGDNRFEDLLEPLKQLRPKHGVYAILGNHDHAVPGEHHVADLEQALPSVGVRLLRNDLVQITDCVQLLTADELWAGLDDVGAVFCAAETPHRGVSTKRVFMGHNPDLMLKMKPEHKADLFIFGHTHHGQIFIPFLPGLAVPIRSKFYRGEFQTPNGKVYVSAGVGEGNSPIRINTKPEIVVFDL